jgi:hypothetical protein
VSGACSARKGSLHTLWLVVFRSSLSVQTIPFERMMLSSPAAWAGQGQFWQAGCRNRRTAPFPGVLYLEMERWASSLVGAREVGQARLGLLAPAEPDSRAMLSVIV